jgi:hypothetical protein
VPLPGGRRIYGLVAVDADESVHPQVFEGDTHAGWKVRDGSGKSASSEDEGRFFATC